jgi:hypothetical protein
MIKAYIQSLVLKKTFKSISFERRRGLEEEVEVLVSKIETGAAEMTPAGAQE